MSKFSSCLIAAAIAVGMSLSAFAEFSAWVYDYGSNTPHTTQESWTAANLVDITAGASKATFSGSYNNEVKCFDGNPSTRWIQKVTNPWVIYKFDAATKISTYGIRQSSNNGYDNRVPISWELYGSNAETPPTTADDPSWVLLDTRTSVFHNYTGNNYDFGSRVMWLERMAEYRSYLLKVTSNKSDDYTAIGELEFYKEPFPCDVKFRCNPILSYQDVAFKASVSFVSSVDCEIKAVISDGQTETVETVGAFTGSAEDQFIDYLIPSTLDTNKTYKIKFTSTLGTASAETDDIAFYTGTLSLTKSCDAKEEGAVPAELTVSRAAADSVALTVNVVFTEGTAKEGRNYEPARNPVVIPAGETTATFNVVPLADAKTNEDTEMTVSISSGVCKGDIPAVAVKIINASLPADKNVWIATAASDGLASTAANWSKGVPKETDDILIDGLFSSRAMTWDAGVNGLTATVASWTQTNYAATVEFNTEFPDYASATFPLFTVSGNCEINSGKWTHRGNYNNYGAAKESNTSKLAAKKWCLNVAVGGNLTVSSGASINVTGKGFGHPGNQSAPCYGGYAYNNDQSCAPYGSITEPFDPGMGCRSQGDQNGNRSGIGGGAVKLAVAGDVIVNGSISALGNVDLNVARSGGAGGSIWIAARQISGAGKIDASACPPSNYTSDRGIAVGSGGRIALYTKSALEFSKDNLFCSGSAYQGTSNGSKTMIGSCGTIFIKDSAMANGVLLLKQDSSIITANAANSAVPLIDDLTLDGIEFRGRAVLSVEVGKTLTLPGGLASVSSTSTTIGANGISYRGGVINIGTGDQAISGWMLEPVSNFNFEADVALSNYGAIGIIKRNICGTGDAPIPPRKVAFTVAGDMSVDATSAVDVGNVVGYSNYGSGQRAGWYGGWTTYYDMGGNKTDAREKTYGSVFAPQDVGSSPVRSYLTGGVLDMSVAGVLTLGGKITSSGPFSDSTTDKAAPSSGGSIRMVVGSIAGTGSITACGGAGRRNYAGGGGGGRIAIRLTGAGATIPGTIVVNAQGRYGYAFAAGADKLGSAGTVYIETASEGVKGGTIIISNWPDRSVSEFTSATVFPTTPIVAYNNGDAVADFNDANLIVTNNAIAEVSVAALKMRNLAVAADSKLDLFGNTLTVRSAKLGDTTLAAGTYAAGDVALGDFVSDSVGGGSLVVQSATRSGLRLILR